MKNMPKYKYESFWDEKGQEPAAPFDETKKNLIRNILKDIDYSTVLEFGCGDGQLSSLIKEKSCHLTGVDISEDRLQMNNDVDAKILNDITKESFYPVSDLIICSHFLLHIKPEHIKETLEKMLKYSSKYVIFIEPNPLAKLGEWEYYNFQHDYNSLLVELGLSFDMLFLTPLLHCWIITK